MRAQSVPVRRWKFPPQFLVSVFFFSLKPVGFPACKETIKKSLKKVIPAKKKLESFWSCFLVFLASKSTPPPCAYLPPSVGIGRGFPCFAGKNKIKKRIRNPKKFFLEEWPMNPERQRVQDPQQKRYPDRTREKEIIGSNLFEVTTEIKISPCVYFGWSFLQKIFWGRSCRDPNKTNLASTT